MNNFTKILPTLLLIALGGATAYVGTIMKKNDIKEQVNNYMVTHKQDEEA